MTKHDETRTQPGTEIQVTDEMVEAGRRVFISYSVSSDPSDVIEELLFDVYCAMRRLEAPMDS